jgi:hypothetical protein
MMEKGKRLDSAPSEWRSNDKMAKMALCAFVILASQCALIRLYR